MQRFTHLSEFDIAAICGGFAAVCGALSYLLKVEEGKVFKWREFALHTVISAICGVVTYEVMHYYGMPSQVAGALCGMSGWMGTRGVRIVEAILYKRAGVKDADTRSEK